MIEQRLKELKIELPDVAPTVANFLPYVQTGNLLFVSGQVPFTDDGKLLSGSVGDDFTVEEATEIARRITITLLAVVKLALGDLDKVVRVVKINGSVNAYPGFKAHPAVINGCSNLLVEVFGEKGRHARAAVGVESLPGNVPVELEGVFEVAS
ncbi:MAG: RidA family protein [Sphingomonadales bacterium]